MPSPGAVGPTEERLALARQVAELRSQGLTQREVGERLGVKRTWVSELDRDPDGSIARARKDSYRGVCVDCGGPTSGSEGPNARPQRCAACAHALQIAEKPWDRDAVIDAIQRFAAAHGRPPTATEWVHADPVNVYPCRGSVYRSTPKNNAPFAKWADAIEAAGFPRPRAGHYDHRPRGESHQTKVRGETVTMRDYVVLEQRDDGNWIAHQGIQAYNEQTAIEKHVEALGETNGAAAHRYVAISAARWVVRELQQVTSFKAVPVEA